MKSRLINTPRTMFAATLLALVATGIVVVACAESTFTPEEDSPDAQLIPSPSTESDGAALPLDDAGCDDDGSDCGTAPPAPCEGVAWCPATNPADSRSAFTSVWGTSKDDVWAVGSAGTVVHFDGAAWKNASLETTRTLFSVGGSGPDDVWIVGTYGTIYHRAGGGTWEAQPIVPYLGAAEKILTRVWSTSPDDVWISGESLKIPTETKAAMQYRRTVVDGGARWQAVSPCSTCTVVSGVWGPSPDEVWSVGSRGKAYRTTIPTDGDGGAPVSVEIATKATQDLRAVWGSSKDDIWLVGRRGTLRRCLAGATECESVEAGTTEDLHAVWGSAADDVWVAGANGTILHFDGKSWSHSTAAFPAARKPNLYGVWGSAGTDVWIVGENALLHFTGANQ